MNRIIYSDHGLYRPHSTAPLGETAFCRECGCGVHKGVDHCCVECGGCSERLKEKEDWLDKWIERVMWIGVVVCIAVAIKVRLFP